MDIERVCRWYFLFILFSKQYPFAGIGEIVDLVNEEKAWIESKL